MFETYVIATAFPLGFLGGLHCIGMCGPIVVALSRKQGKSWRGLTSRLAYNIGRTLTYMLLGVFVGVLAEGFRMAGYQRWVSIAIGAILLIGVLLPAKWINKILPQQLTTGPTTWIRKIWAKLPQSTSAPTQLVIGILNGFLPCGLVYTAAAAASAMGSMEQSVAYMAWFGLGTIPALLVTSYAGMAILNKFRISYRKLTTIAIASVAVLLILRGMNLGIPYISPKIQKDQASGKVTMDCCHPEE
ncbi:sulfite exporter TauE/SafE family protein [bacterium]|nr:sulfite exporter TauE/SafE family protein [bacterium]